MLPRFATTILWLILLLGALVGAPLRARSEGEPIEADAQGKAKFRREQNRPIKLGTSGGSARDRTVFADSTACCSGTLGGLVEKNGKLYVLSNNHVIARINKGKKGEAIIQPG